jgi:hypothetical protein
MVDSCRLPIGRFHSIKFPRQKERALASSVVQLANAGKFATLHVASKAYGSANGSAHPKSLRLSVKEGQPRQAFAVFQRDADFRVPIVKGSLSRSMLARFAAKWLAVGGFSSTLAD